MARTIHHCECVGDADVVAIFAISGGVPCDSSVLKNEALTHNNNVSTIVLIDNLNKKKE